MLKTWLLLHTPHSALPYIQVKLLVEKTGCDAATLSAPFVLHGSEAGLLEDATLQTDPTIQLRFSCEELLVRRCCCKSPDVSHAAAARQAAMDCVAMMVTWMTSLCGRNGQHPGLFSLQKIGLPAAPQQGSHGWR